MNPERDESARTDPLIEEIRTIRKELSDRFDNDPARLCEYLRQVEAEYSDRLAHPPRDEAEVR